jgi:hypothetical protein
MDLGYLPPGGEVLPDPLPECTFRVGFVGGAVPGVLGFFLEVLLTDFSFGSFKLSAGAPIPVTVETAMAPRASCSKLFPPYVEGF